MRGYWKWGAFEPQSNLFSYFSSLSISAYLLCFMNDTGLNVLNEKNTNGLNSLDLNLSKKLFFYYI